jgi:hypothetical protein
MSFGVVLTRAVCSHRKPIILTNWNNHGRDNRNNREQWEAEMEKTVFA